MFAFGIQGSVGEFSYYMFSFADFLLLFLAIWVAQ
jgi:hypothetical protein